eukprot:118489-Chlamydomonas_euryale.AAC.1
MVSVELACAARLDACRKSFMSLKMPCAAAPHVTNGPRLREDLRHLSLRDIERQVSNCMGMGAVMRSAYSRAFCISSSYNLHDAC